MKIENLFESELPDHVKKAFVELGEQQRNRPERAMLQVQDTFSGAINEIVEHVGDLTHRMTHQMKWGADKDGYETVKEKLNKTIGSLGNGYGFENELGDNIAGNAKFFDKDPEEIREELNKVLKIYAREHSKLTVYNEAQWLAQHAAIAVGMQKWKRALYYLTQLDRLAKDKETWNEAATDYELDDSGNLKDFTIN